MAPYITAFAWALMVSAVFRSRRVQYGSEIEKSRGAVVFILALAASLPLIVLLAVRKDVGTDYSAYVDIFEAFREGATIWWYEPLYSLLNILGGYFGAPGIIFVFAVVASLSTIPIFIRVYESSYCPWLSIVILFGMAYPFLQTNAVRFSVAVAIIFFVLPAIWNKKPGYWFVGGAFASGFHYTALMVLPFYWILRLRTHVVVATFLLLLAIILSTQKGVALWFLEMASAVVPSYYAIYPDWVIERLGEFRFGLGFFWHLALSLFTLAIWRRLGRIGADAVVIRNAFFYGLIVFIASYQFWAVGRFGWYFLMASVLFFPLVASRVFCGARWTLIIGFAAAYGVLFLNAMVIGAHDAVPYRSIF